MAEYVAGPSCTILQLQRSCFKASDAIPRNACFRLVKRKHLYGNSKVVLRFSSRKAYELSAPIATTLNRNPYIKEDSLRCFCLGTLINAESSMPSNWIPVLDQVLLAAGMFLAYMAGVVPSEKAYFNSRKKTVDPDSVSANSTSTGSAINSGHQVNLKHAWDEVREKLMDALDAIGHEGNLDNRVVEREKNSSKRPLSLYAIAEGPRLRLFWTTLQQLEKEVRSMSRDYGFAIRDDFLAVLSEIIQKSSQPVCLAWLEEELYLENKKADKEFLSMVFEKLKVDDTILQSIKRSGKEDLFADLLFFLRFGSLREVCRYDSNLFIEHVVEILEDLVITLADGITSIYLELISVDSNMSSEMNRLGLTLCCLSTRALQRLRNEVALDQWLHQNMESVVSMYEDRFDLSTLQVQFFEEPNKSHTEKFHWWKKLIQRKTVSTLSLSRYVVISQLSMPVKRTKELRALRGWRYYYSLFLEFSDISMPMVRAIFAKVSSAISFFLVCLIGRSLGLIYTGIKQSLGWR